MSELTKDNILIANLFLPKYLKKIVIDTGDWSFSKEKAEHIKQYILETMEIRKRLNQEIQATENLISEGNPFTLTQEEYLKNLEHIKDGGKK